MGRLAKLSQREAETPLCCFHARANTIAEREGGWGVNVRAEGDEKTKQQQQQQTVTLTDHVPQRGSFVNRRLKVGFRLAIRGANKSKSSRLVAPLLLYLLSATATLSPLSSPLPGPMLWDQFRGSVIALKPL